MINVYFNANFDEANFCKLMNKLKEKLNNKNINIYLNIKSCYNQNLLFLFMDFIKGKKITLIFSSKLSYYELLILTLSDCKKRVLEDSYCLICKNDGFFTGLSENIETEIEIEIAFLEEFSREIKLKIIHILFKYFTEKQCLDFEQSNDIILDYEFLKKLT